MPLVSTSFLRCLKKDLSFPCLNFNYALFPPPGRISTNRPIRPTAPRCHRKRSLYVLVHVNYSPGQGGEATSFEPSSLRAFR